MVILLYHYFLKNCLFLLQLNLNFLIKIIEYLINFIKIYIYTTLNLFSSQLFFKEINKNLHKNNFINN